MSTTTGQAPGASAPVRSVEKLFATLQAKAALHGFECTMTKAGNIVMSRHGGAWIFGTLAEASHWLSLSIGEIPGLAVGAS